MQTIDIDATGGIISLTESGEVKFYGSWMGQATCDMGDIRAWNESIELAKQMPGTSVMLPTISGWAELCWEPFIGGAYVAGICDHQGEIPEGYDGFDALIDENGNAVRFGLRIRDTMLVRAASDDGSIVEMSLHGGAIAPAIN